MRVNILLRICNALNFAFLAIFTVWAFFKGGWGELIALFFLPFVVIAAGSLWAAVTDRPRTVCIFSALLPMAIYLMLPYIGPMEWSWPWQLPLIAPVITLVALFPDCLVGPGRSRLSKYFWLGKLLLAVLAAVVWFQRTDTAPVLITSDANLAQSPVMLPEIEYNDGAWSSYGPPGEWSGTPPPKGGGNSGMPPTPIPAKAKARWFHLSQQRFYEAILNDPAMPEKARAIVKQQPPKSYKLSLIATISDSGEFQIWLDGTSYEHGPNWHHFTELLGSVQAHEVPGDVNKYKTQTAAYRRDGEIPQQPVPPPRKE